MNKTISFCTLSMLGLACGVAAAGESLPTDIYFFGRDITPKVISGAHVDPGFVGLDNPNYNRLTFLYAHWVSLTFPASNANHYHGTSRYEYEWNNGIPTVVSHQHDGNLIPGISDLLTDSLKLTPGSGAYAGKLVSYQYPESVDPSGHYSNMTTRGTAYLGDTSTFPLNSAQNRLYNGNFGKYTGSLAGSNLAMELVSITPGLHVGIGDDIDIFDGGSISPGLGDAGAVNWQFSPVFWVDQGTTPQTYTAEFRLKDLNSATTGYLDSGEYGFVFTSVPEPASLGVLAIGGLSLLQRRRRTV